MPRIRTLKPEFFRSPSTAKVEPLVRIFYQALWCWADDFGIGETNVYGLLGFAFPDSDEISAQDLRTFCADCAQHYGVIFYIVRERHYYAIPQWDQHQKTERREDRRKNPTPDDPDAIPDLQFQDCADSAPICADEPARKVREKCAGTGEQGNRGTGEVKTCATPSRDSPPRFAEFWSSYPLHRDRRNAEKAFTSALKRADPDTIIAGAARYTADPNREIQFTKYAQGWLNGDGWLDDPLPNRMSRINGNHVYVATSDLRVAQVQALKNRPDRLEIEP